MTDTHPLWPPPWDSDGMALVTIGGCRFMLRRRLRGPGTYHCLEDTPRTTFDGSFNSLLELRCHIESLPARIFMYRGVDKSK
jgi:hypothetical protein